MGDKFKVFQDERVAEIKNQFELQQAQNEAEHELKDSSVDLEDN